jgi:Flagellar C1a complex subunit C1a-32
MANNLQGTISVEDFQFLRSTTSRCSPRDRLAKVMGVADDTAPKNQIRTFLLGILYLVERREGFYLQSCTYFAVVDLYSAAMRFCAKLNFEDVQTSTLLGIIQSVHTHSMSERRSFSHTCKHLNRLLLAHSIHRPPWSVCVFTLEMLKKVTNWMHSHYLAYYPCFQYAFTPCISLSFSSTDPRGWTETPPALPGLAEAIDEETHEAKQAELHAQQQEQEAALAAKVQTPTCGWTASNCRGCLVEHAVNSTYVTTPAAHRLRSKPNETGKPGYMTSTSLRCQQRFSTLWITHYKKNLCISGQHYQKSIRMRSASSEPRFRQ